MNAAELRDAVEHDYCTALFMIALVFWVPR